MKQRYRIRLHFSGESDGSTAAGTFVQHIGGNAATIEAQSFEEVEAALCQQAASGKLSRGCVYGICPPAGSSVESMRSLAIALDGHIERCYLESAHGLYSGFRRIRLAQADAVTL